MKPTKNKIFCKDCGRHKMIFETEKKAETFIKFNSEDIESESGYSPTRSYFCIYCGGYHVTSKTEVMNIKSKTERIVDTYIQNKEKRAIQIVNNAETRKNLKLKLINQLDDLEKQIIVMDSFLDAGNLVDCAKLLTESFAELDLAKNISSYSKRKMIIESNLNDLKKKIELKNYHNT